MKKKSVFKNAQNVIQIILLLVAILIAFLISIFGATEIANWLNTNFGKAVFTAQDVYSRIVLLLLAVFFVEVFFERITTFNTIEVIEQDLRSLDSKIRPFFSRFSNSKYRRYQELFFKYTLRGSGTQVNDETFTVNRENSIALWRDCISEAKSWEALSYALDLWDNNEQIISKAHQDVFMRLNGKLTRVFIFDSDKDRSEFEKDLANKDILESGDVRWIVKSELIEKVKERTHLNVGDLGLIDFALVDNNNYVLWFKLVGSSKKLAQATMTVDDRDIQNARRIFDVASANSREFTQE